MRYGFAIDQRTCIGCHACTVACKTEHEVPVGQFRTWVKYVDRGTFPQQHPRLRGHALQPLHRRALRDDLPDQGAVPARGRHRRLRPGPLHRLQELHAGLPVRRDLHRRGHPHRSQVQLLRAPDRRRPRTRLRRGLSDALDLGGRPRRPGQRDLPAGQREPGGGARAGAEHRAERVLPRRRPRGAGPARGAGGPQLRLLLPRRAAHGGGAGPARRPRRPRPHDAQHGAPAAVGVAGEHLPVDQGRRWWRAARRRARRAARRRPRSADHDRRARARGGRDGRDRGAADLGPQAS